jgi:pimeloyl-ACP methyl ester carboxylesterase
VTILKSIGIAAGGLLVLALLLAGVWAWAPDRSRAGLNEKYLRPSDHFLEVSGATLRVRDIGSKTAPVIVLLHGFGSSLETWQSWATALAADHRVIYFDFPGCGLSPPDPAGDYGDARTLEIVTALLDRLGVDKAVFVGNSMGGRIAWKMAAERPSRVSKLVLISPDGFSSPGFDYGKPAQVPRVLTLMRYFLPRAVLRANLAVAYADPNRLSDSVLDRYYGFLLAAGNRDAMLERMKQTVLVDPVPMLRAITAPTLVMWGEKDAMIPHANSADYMRELPHGTLVSFADLGHVPQEESPDESLVPLREFLLH